MYNVLIIICGDKMLKKQLTKLLLISFVMNSGLYGSDKMISLQKKDGVDIGFQIYDYDYEEEVDNTFFMSNTGKKYGISLSAVLTIDEYYLRGMYRYATKDLKYKSASGEGDVSDKVHEVRFLGGKEVLVETYMLGSYIGLGYRLLENDLRDLGSGGYRRKSEYLYIPVGITHAFRVNPEMKVTTNIEYDYLIEGRQTSYLSDIGPAYASVFGDPVNKQKDGYGFRASLDFEREYISFGAFVNYWKIKDSEINYYQDGLTMYGVLEPYNETTEVGVEIKYKF